jgi:hypothetical protein
MLGGGGGGGGGGGEGGGGSAGGAFFQAHRLLRCTKNRFGPAGEVGLFEMTPAGFVESSSLRLFLSGGAQERRPPGCAVGVVTEGSRALCVEAQALTSAPGGPYPRLRAAGVAAERLQVVHAVLCRHGGARCAPNALGRCALQQRAAQLRVGLVVNGSHGVDDGGGREVEGGSPARLSGGASHSKTHLCHLRHKKRFSIIESALQLQF